MEIGIFYWHLVSLRPFDILHGHLEYFQEIWYIFISGLVHCTQKNLATLLFLPQFPTSTGWRPIRRSGVLRRGTDGSAGRTAALRTASSTAPAPGIDFTKLHFGQEILFGKIFAPPPPKFRIKFRPQVSDKFCPQVSDKFSSPSFVQIFVPQVSDKFPLPKKTDINLSGEYEQ
jgi:hypothetical protein